jgi:hypothetical protein
MIDGTSATEPVSAGFGQATPAFHRKPANGPEVT